LSPVTAAARRVPVWAWALICGLAAALAHPPFAFLPGLLGYAGLLALCHRAPSLRSAFWRGWLAGLSYFTLGCWWVFEAFQVDAATFGWMAPFAVALLAGGLALFWGVAALLYRLGAAKNSLTVVWFATAFALLGWAQGHVFTGFPWNLPGESWKAGGMMSQTAALVGAYGLTWITLAACSAPALIAVNGPRRSTWVSLGMAVAVLAAMAGYGSLYLDAAPDHPGRALSMRIVQPNFAEAADYPDEIYHAMLDRYLEMTRRPSDLGAPPQIVFWPEGALPRSVNEVLDLQGEARGRIAAALAPDQTLVFSGFIVRGQGQNAKYYNSLVAVRRTSEGLADLGFYEKYRLVPFGEYTPAFFKTLGLQRLVPTPGDSVGGPPPAPLDIGLVTMQPLICYESLFPGFTRQGERRAHRRANLIVNLSNDSWFGVTSGPLQTYNLSSYRAIEEGLMLVRSTPNGVSAVIDPHGRALQGKTLGLHKMGIVDVRVNTVQFDTLYRRFGEALFAGMLLMGLLALLAMKLGKNAGT
jgi:apolipoprotein N-acyltransferase